MGWVGGNSKLIEGTTDLKNAFSDRKMHFRTDKCIFAARKGVAEVLLLGSRKVGKSSVTRAVLMGGHTEGIFRKPVLGRINTDPCK